MHTHTQTMSCNYVIVSIYHLGRRRRPQGQHSLQRSGQLSPLLWIPARFVRELVELTYKQIVINPNGLIIGNYVVYLPHKTKSN